MKTSPKDDPVNKIREIVFGNQMRDYDQRFAELGNRLATEVGQVKSDLKLRLDGLEALIRSEIASINEKIQKEGLERNEMGEAMAASLQAAKNLLIDDISSLDALVNQNIKSLQKELQQQGDNLSDKMNREVEEMSDRLTAGLNRVSSDNVARRDLSEMLEEVALKLKKPG